MRLFLVALLALAGPAAASAQSGRAAVEVKRHGAVPPRAGSTANFIGAVRLQAPFQGRGVSRVGGATVSFEPGARTAWHTHPLGQTLVVSSGCGLVQGEGAAAVAIRSGDVVWIPPGVRHWHGASPITAMTHVAIGESLDGKSVDWMEHVSAAQYSEGARAGSCSNNG